MAFQINPHLDEQNHLRCHYTEVHYMQELEARNRLIRIDNVAIDVEQMIFRNFQCDTGYCVKCSRSDGTAQYKGSCCTDLEVDLTPVEIEQVRTLGRMAEERLQLAANDPLRDVVRRINTDQFIQVTGKGEHAFSHLRSGRCSLSWLEGGKTLRCGINSLCYKMNEPLGKFKPDPCILFPLHYVEYRPGFYLVTVLCSETQPYLGCDVYVGKLRCLSKPQAGIPPVYQSLKYEIELCLGEAFYTQLDAAAQPYLALLNSGAHAASV